MTQQLDVPLALWRTAQPLDQWMASARGLLALTCRRLGLEDLGGRSVLDVGCGTKLSKVLLEDDLPLGRYVGVDAYAPVIEFLQANVHDPRFSYRHIDVHNDLYNPHGTPLAELDRLPVGDEPFDVITLFSVFTHLAPHDYVAMLEVLRPHVAPTGRLLYSLYIDEPTDSEHGVRQVMAERMRRQLDHDDEARHAFAGDLEARLRQGDDEVQARMDEALRQQLADPAQRAATLALVARQLTAPDAGARAAAAARFWAAVAGSRSEEGLADELAALGVGPTELAARPPDPAAPRSVLEEPVADFVDAIPDEPLKVALYNRGYAHALVEGTGWEIVEEHPPEPYIQHHLVCRPV